VKVTLSLCLSTMPWRRICALLKHHAMETY